MATELSLEEELKRAREKKQPCKSPAALLKRKEQELAEAKAKYDEYKTEVKERQTEEKTKLAIKHAEELAALDTGSCTIGGGKSTAKKAGKKAAKAGSAKKAAKKAGKKATKKAGKKAAKKAGKKAAKSKGSKKASTESVKATPKAKKAGKKAAKKVGKKGKGESCEPCSHEEKPAKEKKKPGRKPKAAKEPKAAPNYTAAQLKHGAMYEGRVNGVKPFKKAEATARKNLAGDASFYDGKEVPEKAKPAKKVSKGGKKVETEASDTERMDALKNILANVDDEDTESMPRKGKSKGKSKGKGKSKSKSS
mgnify:FL=1